jgi:predicted acetyltransferase
LQSQSRFVYAEVMKIIPISEANAHIFDTFEQDYESEFSAITKKEPNVEGRFAIEADWRSPNSGLYLFLGDKPAGFAVRAIVEGRSDIAEFYILPCYRKKGFGKQFAFAIFDFFPGSWQVRQIITAKDAIAFGRAVIDEYTDSTYTEDIVKDDHWGMVLCQYFESRSYSAIGEV